MDLTAEPAREAWRAEVREWLAANVPSKPLPSLDTAEGFAAHRDWERRLAEARLSVVTWPEEYPRPLAPATGNQVSWTASTPPKQEM